MNINTINQLNKNSLNNRYGDISAGSGYSTDSQQVTSQACYNATASALSGQTASIQLDSAQSFSDIQRDSRVSVDVKGGVGMFSASAEATYLRSMEDKEYSMSLNYYSYAYATASTQLAGAGLDALTETGKSFYNNGTNPYFGLICGDQYISSYDVGAMLLMGINIEFSSSYQKEQFDAHIGASFGNIFSASSAISQIATQYHISGSVVMQAFQTGGDPSQLSHILSKNGNGDYYALTCSLNSMSDCVSAASGMLDYARNDFTTQFSFKSNTGLTPLGVGFMQYKPIYYIGLTPPQSLVTKEVLDARDSLAEALKENQYYEQNFYGLINGYPVAWNTASSFYKEIQTLYQRAQNNIVTIQNPGNPDAGALGCFDFPDQCESIKQSIANSLNNITIADLGILQQVKGILPVMFGTLYPDGSGWNIVPDGPHPNGDTFLQLLSAEVTDSSYKGHTLYRAGDGGWTNSECDDTPSSDGWTYSGNYYVNMGTDCSHIDGSITYTKQVSPFYFEAYSSTNDESDLVGNSHHGESIN